MIEKYGFIYSCRKIMKGKIQGKKMNHEESK